MFKRVVKSSEKGAAGTIPLMISTFGGAMFLFSFYNLSQYTSARSAADQAARRAARCLSATDAECREQSFDYNANQNSQNWYGYNPAQGPTTILVDTYTYNGRIYYENIGARYNSFEVQTGNPIIRHTEKTIKPTRFYGLLNSYQLLRADLTLSIRNRTNGEIRACRLKEAVELPAGVSISKPENYTDPRWCNGHTNLQEISQAEGCADAGNGNWELTASDYCRLTVPTPRAAGDQPWLLLGGSPVCDGDPEAPYSEIPQSESELQSLALSKFGSSAEPGTTGRAFAVTPRRQFVVVEVFTCNPETFKSKLENSIRNKDDLVTYFTSAKKRGFSGDDLNPDVNGKVGSSAFVYQGAQGMSYIAHQNWTYFEWTRQADGIRHLERKVCEWMTYDQVKSKFPEFNDGSGDSYASGSDLMKEIQTYTFYDAPSCLESISSEKLYTCPNRTIVGQISSFDNCSGWKNHRENLEKGYQQNAKRAIELNSNQSWVNFESLPTDFKTQIEPSYSQAYDNPRWEFSWSNTIFNGHIISSPAAVRDKNGYNPKELNQELQQKAVVRTDNQIDPAVNDGLARAIAQQEGISFSSQASFISLPTGVQTAKVIQGAWPFIKDQEGKSVKTVRPFVNNEVSGTGYDFDTDCLPDDSCSGAANHNSLDETLRHSAASLVPEVDLKNPIYKFEYTEEHAGVEFLNKAATSNYPTCTQFRTMCQKDIGSGAAVALGSSKTMPDLCKNGTFVNCYASYENQEITPAVYKEAMLIEKAKLKALDEVRKLIPAAHLCENDDSANCVSIKIQQNQKEIEVAVTFSAELTTPFKEILGMNILNVTGNKREIIETERLRD